MKGCILHYQKKGNLRINKNYSGITLTAIVTKVYNALLLNCIQHEIKKILMKNQNEFQRNWFTNSQILICWIIKEVFAKNLKVTLLFLQGIWLSTQREDKANTSSIWSPLRNCNWCSSNTQNGLLTDGDIDFWILAITVSVYNLPRLDTININRSNERKYITLKKTRSRWYPTEIITDADNADNLVLLANTLTQNQISAA